MRYAWIENGVVTNTIVLNDRNAGDFPKAVKMGDLPVRIGDGYIGGKFYRDGEALVTELEKMQTELEQYKSALQTLGVDTEEMSASEG
nr:MAG TPA: hypothetical protein [Caudoviricetes sp.]